MFWKIIVEKLFGINISKADEFDIQESRTDTVKSVAKLWEKELVQQALFVQNVTTLLSKNSNINKSEYTWKPPCIKKETHTRIPRPYKTDNASKNSLKINKVKSPTNSILSQRARDADIGRSSYSFSRNNERTSRKLHRCTSVRVKMADQSCETCDIDSDELKNYKKNVEFLQQKCNVQDTEIEKLRKENNSLKIELQNFYKTSSWKTAHHSPITANYDKTAVVPKPFECCIDDSRPTSSPKNTDSEMIITMKNCRNEVRLSLGIKAMGIILTSDIF